MRLVIALGTVIGWGFLFPFLVHAAALPADGGQPGKAYKACIDAVAKPDKAAAVELCFAKDDPWIQKTNVGYFSNESFQVELRIQWPALRLVDVKITGGQMDGDQADIFVEGTMILQREEPTGDIIEVDRYPVKGTVKLRLANGVWRYAGQQKLER